MFDAITRLFRQDSQKSPAIHEPKMAVAALLVHLASVDGAVYAKHGTTFDTKLTVIDKIAADDPASFPQSAGLAPDVGTLMGWIADRLPARPSVDLPAASAAVPARTVLIPAAKRSVHCCSLILPLWLSQKL